MGIIDFVLERTCPEEHLNLLSKSGFVSEDGHSGCKSQNTAIRALKGNVLCQIWFHVPCSRMMAGIRCLADRNRELFLISHIDYLFIFGQCGDNCK